MQGNILSIGDKIELSRFNNRVTNKERRQNFVSQLLDFHENNKASISMPIENGRIIPLEIGEKYELMFYTKNGLYKCSCVVTDRYKSERLYVAVVDFTADLEKFQRRQYFRFECVINMKYRMMQEDEIQRLITTSKEEVQDVSNTKTKELEEGQPISWINGVITDISGGGVRFNSESFHDSGDKIMLNFSLFTNAGFKVFHIISSIISTSKVPNRSLLYEHRVEFMHLNKEDRESIVRYVFDEQRKQRRKETGRK